METNQTKFYPIVFNQLWSQSELQKVLTFRIANLTDDIRKASQTFRIAIGLLSFFKTFRVALLPRYTGFYKWKGLKNWIFVRKLRFC